MCSNFISCNCHIISYYSIVNIDSFFSISLHIQLCKDHFVNVDPSNVEALENSGYPDKFIKSALKLSNNSMEKAAELIQKMMARDIDLKGDSETKDSVTAVPFSTSSTISRSYSATGKELQQQAHTLLTSKRLDVDPFTGLNTLITDGDQDIESLSEDDEEEEDGQILDPDGEDLESLVSDIEPNAVCFTCLKDERARRNQLVPCSACHREFHTFCLGRRAVPFSLKTTKERQNREKFILKNYRFDITCCKELFVF